MLPKYLRCQQHIWNIDHNQLLSMASLPNQFLTTMFENRQRLLDDALETHNTGELKEIVEGFSNRSDTLRNERFKSNLDTIVACVAFKRSCGIGVGRWLNIHHPDLDEKKKQKLKDLCKFSAGIFKNWDIVKHNLTSSRMRVVDARELSLRKLYDARNISWCQGERRQHPPSSPKPKDDEPVKEYDETKYIAILQKIQEEQILNNVNFDEDQANLIADRIRKDLLQICHTAKERI